jgi:hypothetical protein
MSSALNKLMKGYIKAIPDAVNDADVIQFRNAHPDRPCNELHAIDFYITLSPYVVAKCVCCGQKLQPIRKAV